MYFTLPEIAIKYEISYMRARTILFENDVPHKCDGYKGIKVHKDDLPVFEAYLRLRKMSLTELLNHAFAMERKLSRVTI